MSARIRRRRARHLLPQREVPQAQQQLPSPSPPPTKLPPLPPPPLPPAAAPKAALLSTRHMAAVLILSVVGLVAAVGLAFRACVSPKRPSAPRKEKTRHMPAPPQEEGRRGALLFHAAEADAEAAPAGADEMDEAAEAQAEAQAEAEAGPPVASREPWEHTPVPAAKPARPLALLQEPQHAPQPATVEGEHGVFRRLALMQQLSEAAGASVDEAAPRAAEQASPCDEVVSPAPAAAADFAAASPPGEGMVDAQWFENPLSRGSSDSGGEQEHAEAGPALHGYGGSDDDDSPLPQQLHASEWALLGSSQSPASLAQQPRWSALLPPGGQSASSDEEEEEKQPEASR